MAACNLTSTPLSQINAPVYKQWAITQSRLYAVSFTWTLKNFSCLMYESDSPTFAGGANENIKWYLKLFTDHYNSLSLYIHTIRKPDDKSCIPFKYKFSVLNAQNQKVNAKSHLIVDGRLREKEGFEEFILKRELLNLNLLPNDNLTIVCDIDVLCNKKFLAQKSVVGHMNAPKCNLSEDFAHLLDTHKLSDVKLVVGEQEFAAHKAILGARSDVFAAMFEHEMEEKKSGQVIIDDVNTEVLQEMLHFIYTGDSPKLKEMPSELLFAADKYALKKLKMMCENALLSKLSPETAAETLILADRHNGALLKKETINFIHIHGKDVLKTKSWKELVTKHPILVAETFEELYT